MTPLASLGRRPSGLPANPPWKASHPLEGAAPQLPVWRCAVGHRTRAKTGTRLKHNTRGQNVSTGRSSGESSKRKLSVRIGFRPLAYTIDGSFAFVRSGSDDLRRNAIQGSMNLGVSFNFPAPISLQNPHPFAGRLIGGPSFNFVTDRPRLAGLRVNGFYAPFTLTGDPGPRRAIAMWPKFLLPILDDSRFHTVVRMERGFTKLGRSCFSQGDCAFLKPLSVLRRRVE